MAQNLVAVAAADDEDEAGEDGEEGGDGAAAVAVACGGGKDAAVEKGAGVEKGVHAQWEETAGAAGGIQTAAVAAEY